MKLSLWPDVSSYNLTVILPSVVFIRTKLFLLSLEAEQDKRIRPVQQKRVNLFRVFMNIVNRLIMFLKTEAKIFNFELPENKILSIEIKSVYLIPKVKKLRI